MHFDALALNFGMLQRLQTTLDDHPKIKQKGLDPR
jgi:hypothetical protein